MTEQATPEATPAPISPQNVVSTPEAPPAPDASILTSKLNALLQDPPTKTDLQQLQEQLNQFQTGHPPPPSEHQAPDSGYEDKFAELQREQDDLRSELQSRIEQQEHNETGQAVSQWVTSNAEHYPLINEAGYQNVVFQKILNTKHQTGRVIDAAEAGRLVEEELSGLVGRCAQKMGYVMRDEPTATREEAQISTTTDGLNISVPPDWDNMSDDEQMAYLVRQVEG